MGGKTRIAKRLAEQINAYRKPDQPFWDPFCGGLSMAVALGGAGIVSDAHPALIALYKAVAAGWDPPRALSEDDWRIARELPDSDPLKAFAGFGCSFGGKWFGGYARHDRVKPFAAIAAESLLRDVPALVARGCIFDCVDFLAVEPYHLDGALLYLDPPYAGTTGYSLPFDHAIFNRRVVQWAACGNTVLVSEYAPRADAVEVWAAPGSTLGMTSGKRPDRPRERLYILRA